MTALQQRAYQGHIASGSIHPAAAWHISRRERVTYICLLGRKNPHSSLKATA